jgi:oligopeptide/dipeptide ABC transporter ATP-binding protein
MYAGYIIEEANVKELYANPQHPYTLGLIHSLPRMDLSRERLTDIPGQPPVLLQQPVGCPFSVRCPYVFDRCKENPPLLDIGTDHRAACWWNVKEGSPRDA